MQRPGKNLETTRAFSTLGCPELTLTETLALARRHRIDGVELRSLAGTLELPGYFAANHGTPEAMARALQGEPVRIVALDTSLRLAAASADERTAFLAFVPWAEALGVRWLRVFDGGSAEDPATIGAAAETDAWWREQRAAGGWRTDIMVETHDALLNPAALARFRAAAPAARILWDVHHTWRRGGGDLGATWSVIHDAVVHVHVKDSVDQPGGSPAHRYVLPGEGKFPIRELLDLLAAAPYAGSVCLEWERLWHPELPPLEDALAAAERCGWW